MQPGDRVRMEPMWKYESSSGVVEKITADGYTVVRWDNIPGHWHYTQQQAEKLEVINGDR